MRLHIVFAMFVACSAGPSPSSSSGSSASSSATGASTGSAGSGGQGGTTSVSSSVVGSGGDGGEGGRLPPKPIDCATLNPGFTCVQDSDCPTMTKEQLDACGAWKCVWHVEPNLDAGIQGKKGCVLP